MNKILHIKTVFTLGIFIGLLQALITLIFYIGFPESLISIKHTLTLTIVWHLSITISLIYYFRLYPGGTFRQFFSFTLLVMLISFILERFNMMVTFLFDTDLPMLVKSNCQQVLAQSLQELKKVGAELPVKDIKAQCLLQNDELFTASGFFNSLLRSVPLYAILCIFYGAIALLFSKIFKKI